MNLCGLDTSSCCLFFARVLIASRVSSQETIFMCTRVSLTLLSLGKNKESWLLLIRVFGPKACAQDCFYNQVLYTQKPLLQV